jgi:hypothetical protein
MVSLIDCWLHYVKEQVFHAYSGQNELNNIIEIYRNERIWEGGVHLKIILNTITLTPNPKN